MDQVQEQAPHAATAPEVSGHVAALGSELAGYARGVLKSLAVEGRLAVLSLALIAVLAVVIGMLITTGWLILTAILSLALVKAGAGWPLALGMALLVNLGLAASAWLLLGRISRNLAFRGTREQLKMRTHPR